MEEKYNQILDTFKQNGGRITKQRRELLAIILNNPGCSCKELYYLARSKDREIGKATVYRVVNHLKENGFVRKNKNVIC